MPSKDTSRVSNPTPEDAVEQGRKDALANAGEAFTPDTATEDAVAEGRATAVENIKADKANGFDPEGRTEHPLKNDTSRAAKTAVTKSQLHPTVSKKDNEEK